jgi:hypothetical protein
MFVVFRVKNHDFTPKNHILSNFRGDVLGAPPGSAPACKRGTIILEIQFLISNNAFNINNIQYNR